MIQFLTDFFSNRNMDNLNNAIDTIRQRNLEKQKQLKEDIDTLYKITSDLINSDKDIDYYISRNKNVIVCIFNSFNKLINYNEYAEQYFLEKYNFQLNTHSIKIDDILELLDIDDKVAVLNSLKNKKRHFKYQHNMYISITPILFSNDKSVGVILQLKEKSEDFILKSKKIKINFDYINFKAMDESIDTLLLENKFRDLFSNNKNIFSMLSKFKLFVHNDDYQEVYSSLMSAIFSNVSSTVSIKFRTKLNDVWYTFYGDLLLINTGSSIFNLDSEVNFTVKIAGLILNDNFTEGLENNLTYFIRQVNKFQFTFDESYENNIVKMISFLRGSLNADHMMYLKRSANIFDSKCYFSKVTHDKLRRYIRQWFCENLTDLDDLDKVYEFKNMSVLIRRVKVDESDIYLAFFYRKPKIISSSYGNDIFIELISSLIEAIETRNMSFDIPHDALLKIFDSLDEYVWIKDDKDTLLYMNKKAVKDFIGKDIDKCYLLDINNAIDLVAKEYRELIYSRACNASIVINNNKYVLATKHYVSSDYNLHLTTAKIQQ